MAEEEYPSVPKKREIDLGKGVVILPPERMVTERKEETKQMPETKSQEIQKMKDIKPVVSAPPATNQLIIIGLTLIAVISLIMSIMTMISIANMKAELKTIAVNLREYSNSQIDVTTEFNQPHTITTTIPVKDVLSPFSIPIPTQEIQTEGTINLLLPGYNYPVSIPWKGTLTVFGSLTANASQVSSEEKLKIQYTLPSSGQMKMKLSGKELMGKEMEEVISALERLSR